MLRREVEPFDISDKEFIDKLITSSKKVNAYEAPRYFKNLMSLFKEKIDTQIGTIVLIVLRQMLKDDQHRDTFISNGFALELPFKNMQLLDHILMIMMDFVRVSPEAFDANLTAQFSHFLPRDPTQSLMVLSQFARQFKQTDNPWPMLDLLLQGREHFDTPELVPEYAKLISYLCSTYPKFAKGRGSRCWQQICALLHNKDIPSLSACYNTLIVINKVFPDVTFPILQAKHHMAIPELRELVLSLIISMQTDPAIYRDRTLVIHVVSAAETSARASLVLMQLATDRITAEVILDDGSWMLHQLPTWADTFRLFMVIFYHKKLRNMCVRLPAFVKFFTELCSFNDSSILNFMCVVMRRAELDEEIIVKLSEGGFFREFFKHAREVNTKDAIHAALLMLSTVAAICYIEELVEQCDLVDSISRGSGSLDQTAVYVAIDSAVYPQVREKLQEIGFERFIKQNLNDARVGHQARKYVRLFLNKRKNVLCTE